MKEFFEWIASSAVATVVLLGATCVVVAVFTGIYVTAFVQGREISFWPPKIGPKPIAPSPAAGNSANGNRNDIDPSHLPPDAPEMSASKEALSPNLYPVQRGDTLTASSGRSYAVESDFYGGSTATLFKAKDEDGERVIAKVYWRGLRPNSSPWESFRREFRAAEKLSHRNIVRVFDRGMSRGYPFIIMEYLPGGTLRDLLDVRDRVPGGLVLAVCEQVADAIDFAHAHGVVHGDIKPGNILFESDPNSRVALCDFGIARVLGAAEQNVTATNGDFYGTVNYLPPEALVDGEMTGASDIYEFGVVLFEMLAGRTPFDGPPRSPFAVLRDKVEREPPSIQEFRPVADELAERLQRTLSRDPNRRPESARGVLRGLEAVLREL